MIRPPERRRSSSAVGPAGLPRLLNGYRPDTPMRLSEHLDRHGPPPAPGTGRRGRHLIGVVEAAGLRGRGGAAFPTARKMHAVTRHRRRPVVVGNGAEGEALSAKDRLLMTSLPHLVLDGAVLAAEGVGADEVIVTVDRGAPGARRAMTDAIAARVASRPDPVPIRLVSLPTRYVAGEETALVSFVNGGLAKPTFVPPRPFERGVAGRPTLIQNVETLAHLAMIARYGADWFRELGTADEAGSTLVTVSGVVATPTVCEISLGTPVRDVVAAAGGPTQPIAAFLVGGYYGSWLSAADAWDLPLTNAALRARGAALGTGVVHAFPEGHCGLIASARIARYLADESAGQCGPCLYGLRDIADALGAVAAGTHAPDTLDRLHGWFGDVRGRGACHYPDGVVRFVATALDVFGDEVARHDRDGRCRAAAPPVLPIPVSDGSWQ
ncbi:MAG TPA: NADH-ubiquinone oxidoreductase-F iron-sulfur binding region domain-containing protein [Acidimicrobiia bacterium]|nr:NADH-ubiquinone oxidoreductase-F iron-sulfur binding region domain-containing protein [Acidimicrobiia bacterium]